MTLYRRPRNSTERVVTRIFKLTPQLWQSHTGTSAPESKVLTYKLSDIPGYAAQADEFQKYKIAKVYIRLNPIYQKLEYNSNVSGSSNKTPPPYYFVNCYTQSDFSPFVTSYSGSHTDYAFLLRNSGKAKKFRAPKTVSWKVRPCIEQMYNFGGADTYVPARRYLLTNSFQTAGDWYGTFWGTDVANVSASGPWYWQVDITYVVKFKGQQFKTNPT